MPRKREKLTPEVLTEAENKLLERLAKGEAPLEGCEHLMQSPEFSDKLAALKAEMRSHNKLMAQHVLKPMGLASLAIAKLLEKSAPGLSQEVLQEELPTTLEKFKVNGTAQVEEMLAAQALVLQTLNHSLMAQAGATVDFNRQQIVLQAALKTSNQLRLVLATLSEIRNPRKAIFVRKQLNQMNFSENSKKLGGAASELLGETLNNDTRMDTGTQSETSPSYPALDALASEYRPPNS